MIKFTRGNLLKAEAEALVNTVNEVGVMGKGIALMFRTAFPANYSEYEKAASAGKINVGRMFVTENPLYGEPRWLINFPTKKHWRQPSRIEWIREGLIDLIRVTADLKIRSIALPPLGCGNGGLPWEEVRKEILSAFAGSDVDVIVYEPTLEYQAAPKKQGVEKLTPARALIAAIVHQYGTLGLDCTILEVQKLAWFLSREISKANLKDPLRLKFAADKFGPYDDSLRHLLDAMDGSFLHAAKRLADSSPYDLIWFDVSRKGKLDAYLRSPSMRPYRRVLRNTEALVDGFESPFGLELLATVDWLVAREGTPPCVDDLRYALSQWPGGSLSGQRKTALFDDRALSVALDRVIRHSAGSPSLFADEI